MFRTVPSWSRSQAVSKPVWHIPLLCVQRKTPDDGQRNCPKHVDFHSENKFAKLVHLVGFIIRNVSRCNVTRTSKTVISYLEKYLLYPVTLCNNCERINDILKSHRSYRCEFYCKSYIVFTYLQIVDMSCVLHRFQNTNPRELICEIKTEQNEPE
jgi:hypothetical protein